MNTAEITGFKDELEKTSSLKTMADSFYNLGQRLKGAKQAIFPEWHMSFYKKPIKERVSAAASILKNSIHDSKAALTTIGIGGTGIGAGIAIPLAKNKKPELEKTSSMEDILEAAKLSNEENENY